MIEHIGTLSVWTIVETGFKIDGLDGICGHVELLNMIITEINRLEILIGYHAANTNSFGYNHGATLAQAMLPEVVRTLEAGLIIDGVTLLVEQEIAQM